MYAVRYCLKKSDEPQLPPEYEEHRDVFSEEEANKLPPRGHPEHAIKMTAELPYGSIYSLLKKELKVLREYLDDSLRKGWIRESSSPAGAPILFVPKGDDGDL